MDLARLPRDALHGRQRESPRQVGQLAATWFLALLLAASFVRVASADARGDGRSVLLLAPNASEQPEFRAQASSGIAQAELQAASLDATSLDAGLSACRAALCLGQAARSARTAYALTLRVVVNSGSNRAEAVHALLGNAAGASGEGRASVNGTDVAAAVASAIVAARSALELGGDGLLQVRTVPTDSLVYIDGAIAGGAPSEHRVKPGAHVVSATLSGFVGEQREVKVASGVVAPVELTLTPAPHLNESGRPAARSAWNYVAAGALIVAAAPLIALPLAALANNSRCTGKLDTPMECAHEAHFNAGSGLALAGGVLALAGGVYLISAAPFGVDVEVSSSSAAVFVRGRL